ncbi:putative secreted protein [Streptomyces davaonensis JCM 4913]|uniref:Putative secreted protein n=1 Tax=Streptomyces davaonensis (strain DSM 101723 / JCM 4913 / KCC S-0913 / 768) TaxID=1214101 RepID=K4QZM1_STRDJ|nr:DUF6153 family protein [Streptomyces davaonensis]CCK25809.1 putative secreted protein [Streptomyces davaonensis JCM 4913]
MMTAREFTRPRTGGTARWTRGMLVTLCAVFAVLLHHELPGATAQSASATAMHALPGSPSTSGPHRHADPSDPGTTALGAGGAACPSMAMHLCSAAGVSFVHLPALAPSPISVLPAHHPTVPGAVAARSTDRAPPDLSVLSQLRI